jgi:hypothetical protein
MKSWDESVSEWKFVKCYQVFREICDILRLAFLLTTVPNIVKETFDISIVSKRVF